MLFLGIGGRVKLALLDYRILETLGILEIFGGPHIDIFRQYKNFKGF